MVEREEIRRVEGNAFGIAGIQSAAGNVGPEDLGFKLPLTVSFLSLDMDDLILTTLGGCWRPDLISPCAEDQNDLLSQIWQ
jgi:hypothetical protein